MMLSPIVADLRSMIRGELRLEEPMERHTSFRIGGPADLFVIPEDEEEVRKIVGYASERGVPFFVLGGGTNIVVRDEGIRGLVVYTGRALCRLEVAGEEVRAGAGLPLATLVRETAGRGLAGLEFAAGIPGTVGGAVTMNAGTRDGAMADVVTAIRAMGRTGGMVCLSAAEAGFGYRRSVLQEGRWVVMEVACRLRCDDPALIRRRVREKLRMRRLSQPRGRPSAGSVFRNPSEQRPAGWLLEAAGAKGMREGDACVSPVHANFIVNMGRATARDVLALMSRMQELVFARFGIRLEPEVQVVGGDGPAMA